MTISKSVVSPLRLSLLLFLAILLTSCGGGGGGGVPANDLPPAVDTLSVSPLIAYSATFVSITASASDPDGSITSYSWSATLGTFSSNSTPYTLWYAPAVTSPQAAQITVTVTDNSGKQATSSTSIQVLPVASSTTATVPVSGGTVSNTSQSAVTIPQGVLTATTQVSVVTDNSFSQDVPLDGTLSSMVSKVVLDGAAITSNPASGADIEITIPPSPGPSGLSPQAFDPYGIIKGVVHIGTQIYTYFASVDWNAPATKCTLPSYLYSGAPPAGIKIECGVISFANYWQSVPQLLAGGVLLKPTSPTTFQDVTSGPQENPGTKRALILVHGWQIFDPQDGSSVQASPAYLRSRAMRVWSDFLSSYFNPPAGKDLRNTYQIYIYLYDTTKAFTAAGGEFRTLLTSKFPNSTQIDVVAHSMGGLITRHAATLPSGTGPAIQRIVTLGTPNHGTPIANIEPSKLLGCGVGGGWSSLCSSLADMAFLGLPSLASVQAMRWDGLFGKLTTPGNAALDTLNSATDPSVDGVTAVFAGKIFVPANHPLLYRTLAQIMASTGISGAIFPDNDGIVPVQSALLDDSSGNPRWSLHCVKFFPTYDYDHGQMASVTYGDVALLLLDWANCGSDQFPPTISITSPANNAQVSGTITVQVTFSDDSGAIDHWDLRVDGSVWATGGPSQYSISVDTTTLANGNHTLQAIATDRSGKTGSSNSVTIRVSNGGSPLQISTTSLPSGTVNQAYSAQLLANGGVPPFTWSVIAGSLPLGLSLNQSGVITGTPTSAGTINFTVQVNDSGSSSASMALFIQVNNQGADTTPPTVQATAPSYGQVVAGVITLKAVAQDNSGIVQSVSFLDGDFLKSICTVNGPKPSGSEFSCSWDTTTTVDGQRDVLVTAYDPSGNFQQASLRFNVNNTGQTYYLLAVTRIGSGSGGIYGLQPGGISCGYPNLIGPYPGNICQFYYPSGQGVALGVSPDTGSTFSGWSGDCNSSGQVTMNASRNCIATFSTAPPSFRLTVTKSGTGTGSVSSSPPGINCGTGCPSQFYDFQPGITVTLSEQPDSGSVFSGWSGDCNSSGQVTMGTIKTCTASFALDPSFDGFESGDLSRLPWQTVGSEPWTVASDQKHSGSYSVRSGNGNSYYRTFLQLTANITSPGQISFYVRYDYCGGRLDFLVDGQTVDSYFGSDWQAEVYPVGVGLHTFTWSLWKNDLGSCDVVWLDDVHLPPSQFANGSRWKKVLGGIISDAANDIEQTADGGYIVAGTTSSYGAGGTDAWLIKIDNSGKVIWSNTYGGPENDSANSVVQTYDGGFAFVGTTASSGQGLDDIWVVKIDANGSVVWQKTLGGPKNDTGAWIRQTLGGGLVVTGTTASFGAGGTDLYVALLDSQGQLIWDRSLGGTANESGNSIIQDSDGNFVAVGQTFSYGSQGTYSIGDIWVLKLSSTGTLLWQSAYNYGESDAGYSVLENTDKSYIIVGKGLSGCGPGFEQLCGFVLKIDNGGTKQWLRSLSFSINRVIKSSDGNFAIAGGARIWGDRNSRLGSLESRRNAHLATRILRTFDH